MMNDTEPRFYATVIREMIRHENDVINHRIMWLLIGQGLFANAFVNADSEQANVVLVLAPIGVLMSLSAFMILYRGYHARGYLQLLGDEAKRGALKEENLPLFGWPPHRIKGWRHKAWICPWIARLSDVLEPYFFLPGMLILAWLFALMQRWTPFGEGIVLLLAAVLAAVILSAFCFLWVWSQSRKELSTNQEVDDEPRLFARTNSVH